jgi:iron complex outermembrane recepter protein
MHAGGAFAVQPIEEIVVTAEKRPEAIQDVPLAVTAMTGEFMGDRHLNDVKDIVLYTPGVTGDSHDSFIDTISIRGIVTNDFGVGGDPSVGFFKNNMYQGRNGMVVTSLYDIERAEVLRGPQQFLFGRNSIAGAVSVFTVKPTFDGNDGYLSLDVGEHEHLFAEGAVNVPVTDHLAFRIAGYHAEENGYSQNVYNSSQNKLVAPDRSAGRLSVRYQGDKTDVNLMLEYEKRDQSGSIYRATEKGPDWESWTLYDPTLSMPSDNVNINSDMSLGERDDGKVFSAELHVDRDLGFATLYSQTGYRHNDYKYAEDFDAMPIEFNSYAQDQNIDYAEHEFRLVSQGDGDLQWYTGVSAYREDVNVLFSQQGSEDAMCYYYTYGYYSTCSDYIPGFTYDPVGLLEQNSVKGHYWGWAAYADVTYSFTPKLEGSLGVRYTYDDKSFKLYALPVSSELGPFWALGFTTAGYLNDSKDWSEWTPRAILSYHVTDHWMVFGSITRGYKSGGYGSFAIAPEQPWRSQDVTGAEANPASFDPETVWSYELGTKGDLLDGTMRVGLNVYYYDYKDLQVTVPGTGGGIIVDNVGQVDGWGAESTVQYAMTDNLEALLNVAYGDTNVTEAAALCGDNAGACENNSLPQVPKWSGSAVVNYSIPLQGGRILLTAEGYGQTKTYGGLEHLSEAINDGYFDGAVRAGYLSNGNWSVTAYVENVTDETHFDGIAQGGAGLPAHYFGPNRPRTYGMRMIWDF